jgi:dolichol kinase
MSRAGKGIMALRKEEIARKLLHLFALLMPTGIFYIPKFNLPWYIPTIALGALLLGSVVIEFLRFKHPAIQKMFFKFFGSMLREEESFKTTGSTYVIGAALLCSIIFYKHPHISFIVLSLFILGDAIAAIVGLSIGKIKIFGKKSLEGSVACFLLCLILFYGAFPFVPGLFDAWNGKPPVLLAFITALSITLFELIPLKVTAKLVINDNLAVPVIAGGILLGLSKMLGM